MKITGIVAEYNPFHNGHRYQIEYCKKEMRSDYVVVVMSGDFVQRGAPAIVDKYARAKMALTCGADLVLELPVTWATASAEYFASGAVAVLDRTGIVDSICFGCETRDPDAFLTLASQLNEEPEDYKSALITALKTGCSYPAARLKAALSCFPEPDASLIQEILSSPNNTLGLEYLRALKNRNSSLQPILLKREGSDYHDRDTSQMFSSASGIRTQLLLASHPQHTLPKLIHAIPDSAFSVLSNYLNQYVPLTEDDFSSILYYSLLQSAAPLASIADCTEELANRMQNQLSRFLTYHSFCESLKSKDLTYTRISRVLLHNILGIAQTDYTSGKSIDYAPYLRVLGFRKESSILFSLLKKNCSLPLITRPKEADCLTNPAALALFQKDQLASRLYRQCVSMKSDVLLPDEDHMPMLVL